MDAIKPMDFLDSYGLVNRVDFPPNRLPNTLDLIITSEDDSLLCCTSQGHLFSDHHVVLFDLILPKKEFKKNTIIYRKLKNIDYGTFATKINEKIEEIEECHGSCDQLVSNFNKIFLDTLDKFAPKKIKVISNR